MLTLLANSEGRTGTGRARGVLEQGGAALDAVEEGVRLVEADPDVRSVGRGGAANLLGEVECDAAVMDGATRRAGAVAALKGYLHAVSVARQVMERLPHVFLAGEGADVFAREIGAETDSLLTERSQAEYQRWFEREVPSEDWEDWPRSPLAGYAWEAARRSAGLGTTVYLAIDSDGNLAGAASTSGGARKYPGRVGDTPLIGAGLYVDNRWGACACTHTGEMAIRAGTAHSVVLHMKRGASVEEACHEALDDLAGLKGGHRGPLIIYAFDRQGSPYVLSTHDLGARAGFCYWTAGRDEIEMRAPATRR